MHQGQAGQLCVAAYDPRSYLKKAAASMTERVIEACNDLHCTGRSVTA